MNADELTPLSIDEQCSLYQLKTGSASVKKIVASTPETRRICNDPMVVGVEYTTLLTRACSKVLQGLRDNLELTLSEQKAIVLHILRGGLNFGLRQSCADAYGWNQHSSAFISAQRARASQDKNDWIITESDYQKIFFHPNSELIFGDVVATGTSLNFALHEIAETAQRQQCQINELIFFTIGGARSHQIIEDLEKEKLQPFSSYRGSIVVYFEGIFSIANKESPLAIKIEGTDLLRRASTLAPEFIESQYEKPSYPLERCAIYDAGSRAFELREYLNDLQEYWEATQKLNLTNKMDFASLLKERAPDLDPTRYSSPDLLEICQNQLSAIAKLRQHCGR